MLRRNWLILLFIASLYLTPHLLTALGDRSGPFVIDTGSRYLAPGHGHPFGTDALGRDMFARSVYAAGLSLKVVVHSVTLSFLLAVLLGGLAGYARGRWPDVIISWVISLLYTVPFILLVIAAFAFLDPGMERAYIIIGCIGWAAPARLVRAEVMRLRAAPFILAERAFGFSEWQVLYRSVLPACLPPALLSLFYYIPELIGIEVGLSFFGLGAQPPTPSLGRLIYEGLLEFYTGWWLSLIPAVVLLSLTASIYGMAHRLLAGRRRYL